MEDMADSKAAQQTGPMRVPLPIGDLAENSKPAGKEKPIVEDSVTYLLDWMDDLSIPEPVIFEPEKVQNMDISSNDDDVKFATNQKRRRLAEEISNQDVLQTII